MIDLLELPPHSFPVVGLCVGHVDKPAQVKPRLPMETFRHNERYHRQGIAEAITAYDATLLQYWKSIGHAEPKAWSKNTAEAYQQASLRPVKAVLQKQGIAPER
jgi:FMN reductase [NAD(P)H]